MTAAAIAQVPRAGLSSREAAARLAQAGPNEIARAARASALAIFLRQLTGVMVWLLGAATIVALILGETVDAIAIGVILVLNAVVGFLQEYRAERSVEALRALGAPRARVVRDGHAVMIAAREIVPGDLVMLEAGDLVPADGRLLEAHALTVNEAALTGESLPVTKDTTARGAETPLAERAGEIFLGTAIASGVGLAEVIATGMSTELGKIAHLLESVKPEPTPLQRQLAKVGHALILACGGIVVVVAVLGVVRGQGWLDVVMTALSLAVAAVPEGLAAIVTIALAIGVQRMAARNVLVRKLPAVETLGCATVICTDKTGTLTTGSMRVRELWGADHHALLAAAAACCDAELGEADKPGSGDTMELAILAAAFERGIERREIEAERPRLGEIPFDSERKRMAVRRADGRIYVKGAVEKLLPLCKTGGAGAAAATDEMANRGMRVLAVAVGLGAEERELELVGLIGLSDPPRTEAIDAVAAAHRAGIKTIMITGDHPVTARAIAREMGIVKADDDAGELVYARATPEDKISLVRRWKERGAVVAMTGDGVNDAPALREAHIGIAMGRTGSDVAREASAMILTDDNFASIVAAIREGRGIFDNIRKALVYLLTGNATELFLMFGAAALGLPLPLLPVHILWVNLVTDGLPALALVADPTDPRALERPPRPPAEAILNRRQWRNILITGVLEGALIIAVFAWTLATGPRGEAGLAYARTMAFTVIVFAEMFRAFAARSEDLIFWEVGAFSNLRLVGVVVITIALQLALDYFPATQAVFGLAPLDLSELARALFIGLIPVTVIELAKLARRKRNR
jgi:P-type Ca2+ transporter type 2C